MPKSLLIFLAGIALAIAAFPMLLLIGPTFVAGPKARVTAVLDFAGGTIALLQHAEGGEIKTFVKFEAPNGRVDAICIDGDDRFRLGARFELSETQDSIHVFLGFLPTKVGTYHLSTGVYSTVGGLQYPSIPMGKIPSYLTAASK